MVRLSGSAEVLNFLQLWEKIVRKKRTLDVYFRNIIVVEGGRIDYQGKVYYHGIYYQKPGQEMMRVEGRG